MDDYDTSDLDECEEAFLAGPCHRTAYHYMTALMEAENEGDINDEDFLDGLALIRDWLSPDDFS